MKIDFPNNVKRIIEIYNLNGHSAYAVGGCVRDSLLGKVPSDWDITTSATPDETIQIFENSGIKTFATGIKHGTVSVLLDGEIYECTTHRVDGDYKDSRRPSSVKFTKRLCDDLSRRDFTVNAMAASPDGGIFDVFGGQDDLKNKIIKCVGDPTVRFSEDALRILRAVRFATVLDFDIEEKTLQAVKSLAHTLKNISAERKTAELKKILTCKYADRGVSLLFYTGIMGYLLPDAVQNSQINLSVTSADFPCRLACLMWQTNAKDLSPLCLSNKEKSTVLTILTPIDFASGEKGARYALSKYGDLLFPACDIQEKSALKTEAKKQKELGVATKISQLNINGSDLLSIGIKPENIGKTLSTLLDRVLFDPQNNDRQTLIRLSQELNA